MTEKEKNDFRREDLLKAVIYFGNQILGIEWLENECSEKKYSDVAGFISGPYFDSEIGVVVFVHPEIIEEEGEALAEEVFYIWKKDWLELKEIARIKNPTFICFDEKRETPLFKKRIFIIKIGNGYIVYRNLDGNRQILNF